MKLALSADILAGKKMVLKNYDVSAFFWRQLGNYIDHLTARLIMLGDLSDRIERKPTFSPSRIFVRKFLNENFLCDERFLCVSRASEFEQF